MSRNVVEKKQIGVFVGRMCPPHIGHVKSIQQMLDDFGPDDCIIALGSSANKLSYRVLFNYEDRRRWVRRLFKDVRVIGIPDVPDNNTIWMHMLEDSIKACFWKQKIEMVFYGGSEEDVFVQKDFGHEIKIVDRMELNISATQVRDKLFRGEDVTGLVPSEILLEVKAKFTKNQKALDSIQI